MAARNSQKSKHVSETVFWTAPVVRSDSLVPGVTDVGNVRPRVKGGRTKEVKASIPIVQPIVQVLDPHKADTVNALNSDLSSTVLDTDSTTTTIQGKQVSLRDLCIEDKKRVANLIKELARLGEEKESAEKNLQEERQHYEEQILKLVEQQEQILSEREEVQLRLLEYQTYILKLQQQKHLSKLQQQKKLNNNERKTTSGLNLKESPKGIRTRQSTPFSVNPSSQLDGQALPGVNPWNTEDVVLEQAEGIFDQPSKNFYMNELEESDDDCSTRAIPSHSLSQIIDGTRTRPERPFTAMIDKEIANQKQILAASLLCHNSPKNNKVPLKNSPSTKTESSTPALSHPSPQRKDAKYLSHDGAVSMNQSPGTLDSDKETLNKCQLFGNTSLLTPEKTELISRLMQSQAEVLQSRLDLERNFTKVAQRENTVEQKGDNRTRQKHRRPPPMSYGPLHAPVMSSTQKSSEIGDYVDSTLVSGYLQNDIIVEQNVEARGGSSEEGNRNNNHNSDDGSQVKTNGVTAPSQRRKGEKPMKSHSSASKLVRQSARVLEFDKLEQAGVDQDFLRRYKKMSPSERKEELLRQRSMLLEEQKRLKLLLAEQEAQLKMKQMDALETKDNTERLSEKEHTHTVKNSMKVMKQDMEKKGQDLLGSHNSSVRQVKDISAGEGQRPEERRQGQSDISSPRTGQRPPVAELVVNKVGGGEGDGANASAESEIKLNGKDGDECVVYISEEKEAVVKRLDYSQQSDTESSTSSRKVSSRASRESLSSTSTEAAVARERAKEVTSPPQHSDASTSVSYRHLPRFHKPNTDTDRQAARSKNARLSSSYTKEKDKSSRSYNSLGEKALLDIINSIDDPDQMSPVNDKRKIHEDRHKVHDDRHKIYEDRHKVHDDRHKIYVDRHKVHRGSIDSDSKHSRNIKHQSELNVNISNCSQHSSSVEHIAGSPRHQLSVGGVRSPLPPSKRSSVQTGHINPPISPTEDDPNLSLFILRRNLADNSPRQFSKTKNTNSDRDRGYDDQDSSCDSQASGHDDFETLYRVISPRGVGHTSSGGIDLMLQTIDAIDDGKRDLLDGKEDECLSDLEESKILEEVFFI